jgi:hypothetical protein
MKNIRNISRLSIALIIFGLSCTPGVHRSAVEQDRRTADEDRFDPLGFPGDDAVVTGRYETPSADQSGENDVELTQPDDTISDYNNQTDSMRAEQSVEVFRVQVFASKSFDEAQQFAANIDAMFPEGVYVEYQMPYYKVRVGEFFTPDEGEAFLDNVKRMGFKNAWLVRVIK